MVKLSVMDIVDKYNKTNNAEIEVRINSASRETTEDIINKLKDAKDVVIEYSQTINVISNQNIKTLTFINGVQDKNKQKFIRKSVLGQCFVKHDMGTYKIGLATEEEIPPFNPVHVNLYRIKWRFSHINDQWRTDITMACETQKIPELTKFRELMFVPNVNNSVMPAHIDGAKYEIEIERIKKPLNVADINNVVDEMYGKLNSSYVQESVVQLYFNKIAHILGKHQGAGIKQLANQPFDLYKNQLHTIMPDINSYYITDKADGERALLYAESSSEPAILVFANRTVEYKPILHAPALIDCEVVNDEPYCFDILQYKGELIVSRDLKSRREILMNYKGSLHIKEFFILDKPELVIKTVKRRKLPYETDGYIITPSGSYYEHPRKIKPLDKLTIDFLVMSRDKKDKSYYLFSGINNIYYEKYAFTLVEDYHKIFAEMSLKKNYFPIQFMPTNDPDAYKYPIVGARDLDLHGKICELHYEDKSWKFIKIRTDRQIELQRGNYFGNDFNIAESIWQSYSNPLTIDDLYNPDIGYFEEHDNKKYINQRHFNSYVKSTVLTRHICIHPTSVIDLAAGKGQDIFRYGAIKAKQLLCVDIDPTAIQELVQRRREIKTPMLVRTMIADLNTDYSTLITTMTRLTNKVDLIVCNFAFHYFAQSDKTILNIVNLVKGMLNRNGRFTFSTFNGARVMNALTNDVYSRKNEAGDMQYKITKVSNNKIKVLLPFGEYEEYVVNIDHVIELFTKNGFKLVSSLSFEVFIDDYKDAHMLTTIDKEYVSLYQNVIVELI